MSASELQLEETLNKVDNNDRAMIDSEHNKFVDAELMGIKDPTGDQDKELLVLHWHLSSSTTTGVKKISTSKKKKSHENVW